MSIHQISIHQISDNEYTKTRSPVIAPLIAGKRGCPVLFDRAVFPEMLELSGDAGARQIFGRYPPHFVSWEDLLPGMLCNHLVTPCLLGDVHGPVGVSSNHPEMIPPSFWFSLFLDNSKKSCTICIDVGNDTGNVSVIR